MTGEVMKHSRRDMRRGAPVEACAAVHACCWGADLGACCSALCTWLARTLLLLPPVAPAHRRQHGVRGALPQLWRHPHQIGVEGGGGERGLGGWGEGKVGREQGRGRSRAG